METSMTEEEEKKKEDETKEVFTCYKYLCATKLANAWLQLILPWLLISVRSGHLQLTPSVIPKWLLIQFIFRLENF